MDYPSNIQQEWSMPSNINEYEKEKMKNFIKLVFKDVIENIEANEAIISQYFSPNYIQHVNGTVLNYDDFVQHMKAQKSILKSIKIVIDHCVVDKNMIATVHQAHAYKKDGTEIIAKVIAYFEIEDGKIVLCDELTQLIRGNKEDENIGSRK